MSKPTAVGPFWFDHAAAWCKIEKITRAVGAMAEAVVTLPSLAKHKIFADAPALSDAARQRGKCILQGIENKEVAALFELKDTSVPDAPFRLVKRVTARSKNRDQALTESFIALSYCWQSQEWAAIKRERESSEPVSKVPISEDLFGAILQERVSDDEGIWIDQLCINQTDPDEKAAAVGSMDAIYQCARIVAVALEDIVVDKTEILALQSTIDSCKREGKWVYPKYVTTMHQLNKLAWKIMSARWFTRAWCAHELFMSDSQIFLIRSEIDDASEPTVIKMSAEFLVYLVMLLPKRNQSGYEFAYARQLSRFLSYALDNSLSTSKKSRYWKEANDTSNRKGDSITPSYMRIFIEIYACGLGASVASDKLSITLNILQCGLSLKGPLMTDEQCCYAFYHVALAAKDPTSLSLCGRKLHQATWMRWPRAVDNGLINEYLEKRSNHLCLEKTPTFNDEAMELDLVLLGTPTDVQRAKPSHLAWAESVMANREHLFLEQSAETFDTQRRMFCELLACLRECGVEWLMRSWKSQTRYVPHKVDVIIQHLMATEAKDMNPIEREGIDCLRVLLSDFMVSWIPFECCTEWMPAWIETGSPHGALLFLCPEDIECSLAIPTVLLRPEHNHLNRLWVVTPKSGEGLDERHWDVIRKSAAFGRAGLEALQATHTTIRSQKICG